jgi:transposase InsO family protein
MRTHYPILAICEALDVSPSGYYDWQSRQANPSPRHQENARLKEQIAHIHSHSRQTYGSPRIRACLQAQGQRHGKNRIARLMREQNLHGRQKKRFRIRTTDSNHSLPIAPNRLAQAEAPQAPNQIWVGDITYILTTEGWLYLASVMDLFSRKVVGWAMSEHIDTQLVLDAWAMAKCHRPISKGLIFHSDRGVQYASHAFRAALEQSGAIPSMSRKGNCYDNAAMEAFWSTLKLEMIYRRRFATRQEARQAIFDYIESFYNRKRIHSSLNYLSPEAFEYARN